MKGEKRGRKTPLFICRMITEHQIEKLVEQAIEGTSIFPVEIKVRTGNKIKILIDADPSLSIDDCVRVSRFVEHGLDRDREDFSLDVSSPGLDLPLKVWKQYEKNKGKSLRFRLNDESKFDGELLEASAGKLKIRVEKVIDRIKGSLELKKDQEIELDLNDITEVKVNIKFK